MNEMKIKRYAKYKNSGIDWIGEVPEGWEEKKISQSFKQIGSGTTPKSGLDIYYENGTNDWINTGDLNDGLLYSCKGKVTDKALEDYSLTIYPKASIIIAMYGATIGKVSISMFSGCMNQACCVLNGSKSVSVQFLFYWFLAKREYIISLSYGGGQPNISQETIKNLRIISPAKEEQTAIANYLDEKTAQIDKKIGLLGKKATQYAKLKQSLINETVTKGLDNKTVKLKDSGVEWIGEIPEHWEVRRAKDVFKKHNRKCYEHDKIITAFRNGQVTLRINRRTSGFTNAIKEHGYQRINSGDLVIHAMDAFAGAIGVSDSIGKSSPVYSAYTALNKKEIFLPYFGMLLREMALSGFISSLGKGIRERSTEFRHREFSPLRLVIPPLPEQTAIANYLDEKTAKIDRIVTTINSQLEQLKELRKVWINEVVTGKIKVINEG